MTDRIRSLQVGDVVILKSGSPPMTIHDIDDFGPLGPNPGALCIWFVGNEKREDVFRPEVLALHSN